MTIRILIAVLVLATFVGCVPSSESYKDMKETRKIKSVDEIQEACGIAASTILPDEDGESFPYPVSANGSHHVQILFYRLSGPLGTETIEIPHYCMWLDPYTADVVRFWPCTPQEIGLSPSTLQIPPSASQRDIPFESLMEKRERFSEISPRVWKLFFEKATSADVKIATTLREYRSLFWETSETQEAKYVVAASPDFFKWLDAVTEKDR